MPSKLVAGIDEAGRGPVLGSLFISIVVADEDAIAQMKKLGVKDSKMVSHPKRVALSREIKKLANGYETIKVVPHEIDTSKLNLNDLETAKMAQLINKFRPEKIIVDCPTVNTKAFAAFLQTLLQYKPEIIAENKADVNHTVVGAASILSKVAREDEVELLRKKWGDFGSGYPSDERTIAWLKDYYKKHNSFPEIARKKWSTLDSISGIEKKKESTKKQKGLFDYK